MRTMDSKLRNTLTECIRDIETGARDVEGCLQRHPDRAADLRPHLELWSRLNAAAKAQPNFGSQQRGRQQLLAALADMERGKDKGKMIPAVARAAVVMAAAALLVGGAAGASAALGGPDITDDVLSTVGIQTSHGTLLTVDENTPDAADFGLGTAQGAADNGLNTAGEHAGDGLNTAGEHAGDGLSTAGEHAADGLNTAGEAQQQSGNDVGIPDGVDLPDNVPDDVPAGPKP